MARMVMGMVVAAALAAAPGSAQMEKTVMVGGASMYPSTSPMA